MQNFCFKIFDEKRELNEKNVIEFIDLLNKLTSKNSSNFTPTEIKSIINILVKVSNLAYLPANSINGFFGVVNNILYASDDVYHNLSDVSNILLRTIDTFMFKIKESYSTVDQEISVQVPNICVSLNDIRVEEPRLSTSHMTHKVLTNDSTTSLSIITNFTQKSRDYKQNMKYRLSIVYFKNSKLFQIDSNQSNSSITSTSIVSVTVNSLNGSTYEKSGNLIEYEIEHSSNLSTRETSYWCGYWKFIDHTETHVLSGHWSTDGCEYIGRVPNGNHKCRCNHTTHYALLFSPSSSTISMSPVNDIILSTFSYIGVGLSILGLCLTLATYTCFKTFRQGTIHKCLVCLASTLLISNCLFVCLSFIRPEFNLLACELIALIFHFFVLVSFMWMLCIAMIQYLNFVKIIDNHIENFMLKASTTSFGLPLIIILTIGFIDLDFYNNQVQKSICWLTGQPLYFSFILPIILISTVNSICFLMILASIFRRPEAFKMNSSIRKNQIGASLCCFVLMGTTWLYGLTLLFDYKYRFANELIFCVLNATQGFLIFVFHVLLSKSKRDLFKKFISKKSSISSIGTKQTTASTSLNGFDFLKQTIKLKLNSCALFSSGNKNLIIVNNNNNIIVNGNTPSSSGNLTSTDGQSAMIQHHIHHHVHHYASKHNQQMPIDT